MTEEQYNTLDVSYWAPQSTLRLTRSSQTQRARGFGSFSRAECSMYRGIYAPCRRLAKPNNSIDIDMSYFE